MSASPYSLSEAAMITSRKHFVRSYGVVKTLLWISPASPMTQMSVNVPPLSMLTRCAIGPPQERCSKKELPEALFSTDSTTTSDLVLPRFSDLSSPPAAQQPGPDSEQDRRPREAAHRHPPHQLPVVGRELQPPEIRVLAPDGDEVLLAGEPVDGVAEQLAVGQLVGEGRRRPVGVGEEQ